MLTVVFQGRQYHWTYSVGLTVAEATNMFLEVEGQTWGMLQEGWRQWLATSAHGDVQDRTQIMEQFCQSYELEA